MKILLAEDTADLNRAICAVLSHEGHEMVPAYDGEEAVTYLMRDSFDCIVLDIMMPKKNGIEVLKDLRENGILTPVLLLTAKAEVDDRVNGLDAGADDYLTKPFIPGELLARVRAISRRQGEVVMDELEFEDLVLSLSNYTLEGNGKSLPLGPKEFEIMRLLMSAPNVIVPKEDFIVKVWGAESDAEDNNVEVYISFLRKKLKHLTSRVSITTVRKIGYRLEVSA